MWRVEAGEPPPRNYGDLPDEYYEEPEPTRGKVTEFSERSRKRLAFMAGNCNVEFDSMTTLTVHSDLPVDARQFKSALNSYLQKFRRKSVAYLWFFEFTKKGAPHVHILHDSKVIESSRGQSVNISESKAESARWANLIRAQLPQEVCTVDVSEMLTKMMRASARVEQVREPGGAGRYATKYAFKMEQKQVPEGFENVGRFWSCSRSVKVEPVKVMELTESEIENLDFRKFRFAHPGGEVVGFCRVQYARGEDGESP